MHQTLPENFQPDPDCKIPGRLWLKKMNQIVPGKFQSTPRPLPGSREPISQTLPGKFQPDVD
jgi:hypothetical protein